MLKYVSCRTHYCVHNANHVFIGTISKYLGRWSFSPRVPFGFNEPYHVDATETSQITQFIMTLS